MDGVNKSGDKTRQALKNILGWADGIQESSKDEASRKVAGWIVDLARQALDAPVSSSERTHPNGLWMVYFEDAERKPEIFFGEGAEAAARKSYADHKVAWSCHLLSRIPDWGRPPHAEAADSGKSEGPESPPASDRTAAALHACEGLATVDLAKNTKGWLNEVVQSAARVECDLNSALRARCPGNGTPADADDDSLCECQAYEASEQGAPCPPGCCVMAETKDVRTILAAHEADECEAPVSANAPTATTEAELQAREDEIWDEVIKACADGLPEGERPHYAQSPIELIYDLINERDELRKAASSSIPPTTKPAPRWVTAWPDHFGIAGNVEVVPASDYDAARSAIAPISK